MTQTKELLVTVCRELDLSVKVSLLGYPEHTGCWLPKSAVTLKQAAGETILCGPSDLLREKGLL